MRQSSSRLRPPRRLRRGKFPGLLHCVRNDGLGRWMQHGIRQGDRRRRWLHRVRKEHLANPPRHYEPPSLRGAKRRGSPVAASDRPADSAAANFLDCFTAFAMTAQRAGCSTPFARTTGVAESHACSTNSIRSPLPRPMRRLTSAGIVTCPLLVITALATLATPYFIDVGLLYGERKQTARRRHSESNCSYRLDVQTGPGSASRPQGPALRAPDRHAHRPTNRSPTHRRKPHKTVRARFIGR